LKNPLTHKVNHSILKQTKGIPMSRSENETYTPKRLTASGLVKNGGGTAGGFFVANGNPLVTLYDGIDNTGTVILNALQAVAGTPYPFPAQFTTGLYATLTGAGDITFFI
jgi:hypothetical protein